MKNKTLFKICTFSLIPALVFMFSFSIASAIQIKGADSANFNMRFSSSEIKTKIYYQSSYFYGGEGKVYAYAWDSKNDTYKNAPWPGEVMTQEDYKHGLYSYEVSSKYDKIIFHAYVDDDPTKTNDLTIDTSNVYYSQHLNSWKSSLSECTFSYYMTGVINSVSGWGNKNYENGLLKNYSGGNINEYLKIDYIAKPNDSFKIIDESGNYYGTGGIMRGGDNYNVLTNNDGNVSTQVYFTPNSNLYCGVNFYYLVSAPGNTGLKWWCHQWPYGSSGTNWPGVEMNRDGSGGSYWYYCNVPLYYNCVIFNNYGPGGNGNVQTNDLINIDISKPYYKSGNWSSSK